MSNQAQAFQSSNAKFQVTRGNGVMVNAGDLGELYVGRGIYHELDRDFEWLYVSAVRQIADGQVEIEYLQAKTTQNRSSAGDTTTEITEHRATRHVLTFDKGDAILLTVDPVARPQGRRVTIVTTRVRTEEPLND